MSKPFKNPFFESADFSKLMDMSQIMGMTKMMNDFKMPSFDTESWMAACRKNVEAWTAANQAAYEGVQAIAKRQAELMRQNMETTTSLMNAVVSSHTPEEKVAKQTEVTKATMERCMANLKEITEMMTHSNYQAMEVISNRMSESLEELRSLVKNKTAA